MTTFSERLNYALKRTDISQSELARQVGVSPQTIQYLCKKGKKSGHTAKLAEVLDVNVSWLARGTGLITNKTPMTNRIDSFAPTKKLAIEYTKIRVFGTARLDDDGCYEVMESGSGTLKVISRDSDAYGLHVLGQSAAPRIKNGEFVCIEPNAEVRPGLEVAIRTKDGRSMIKEFMYERDGAHYFRSINENAGQIIIPTDQLETMHYMAGIYKSSHYYPDDVI